MVFIFRPLEIAVCPLKLTRMRFKIFTILFFLTVLQATAQEHNPKRSGCVYHVPTNNKGSVEPDGHAACAACDKISKAKYEEEARKSREKQKIRDEKIAADVAKLKADRKAEDDQREQRNSIALADLNDINRKSDDFDKIRRDEQARNKAINDKYNSLTEKSNREYAAHLEQLQKAASVSIAPANDSFWNETAAPANYSAFKGSNNLYGYADRQGNVKIQPQYAYVSNFSGGIGYVMLKDYTKLMINAKGGIVQRLDEQYLAGIRAQTGIDVRSINFPDTISNGISVVKFAVQGQRRDNYGGIDKDGILIVPPVFYKIGGFVNGVAVASKYLDETEYAFKKFPENYSAQFTYLEVGLIDKTGKWVKPPQKKMNYSYRNYTTGYLTVRDRSSNLTKAEEDAAEARNKLQAKQEHAQSMKQLEQEVQSRVADAQSRGYLIEKIK